MRDKTDYLSLTNVEKTNPKPYSQYTVAFAAIVEFVPLLSSLAAVHIHLAESKHPASFFVALTVPEETLLYMTFPVYVLTMETAALGRHGWCRRR